MALKFQFNKTAMQQLKKELGIRQKALPTLKAKEAALRVEVKKAKKELQGVTREKEKNMEVVSANFRLWNEFPDEVVKLKNVHITIKKIAGVKTPVFHSVDFELKRISLFNNPAWLPQGISVLKKTVELDIHEKTARQKLDLLQYARKKTTQKVNLYEKVQIPEYENGIRKIKRFLEDSENLAKSSQKILKQRLSAEEAA